MLCNAQTGSPWKKVNGKWTVVETPTQQKWITGKQRKLGDIMKKYNATKLREEKKEAPVQEWIDTSFIKTYSDHEEMLDIMEKVAVNYPDIAERYTVGMSEEGRKMDCIHITQGVKEKRKMLKPMVKYVANIHGDEAVGRELLIGLARYLTENYATDPRVKNIVDTVDIHLLPSVNPDGNAADSRHNVNDEDLNRAFPGWMDLGRSRNELAKDREKEVNAMMKWILDNPFVLSISFHDGRVMINYPWDDSPAAVEGEKAICPDDDVFSELAALYSDNHPFMWTGKCLCHSETFDKGISNGAEWYVVDNGMQDYNYLFSNCMEITAELSCWKRPIQSHLQVEWENNLDSMLAVLESVHGGIRGSVLGEDGTPLCGALVQIVGKEKDVVTTRRGEFWRMLLPGTYAVKAVHSNMFGVIESDLVNIDVVNNLGQGAVELDLSMRIRFEEKFIVTGIKNGGCKYFDDLYFDEVKALFRSDCSICDIHLYDQECRYVHNDSRSRQVAFQVTVVFAAQAMFNFFHDRWGENCVRRPTSEFEMKKLMRRASMYSEEVWCGRKDDWLVRLEEK